ncbi:MAG: hypothetical protein D8M57_18090 [Candidatus Scalindua sp. AMX11]|nr:MAG: hypothetical protein DWQ00_14850 [Candidatus Scalindua sp.]NOG85600.1 hypothetical protein [Planctomycetota bacterium]RZV65367.1 MAG: hypothetical protein EX341_18120 [Candidatus Scalindua sp. SCAELEC01]TDE63479.1 MAG: hypothetical protein D8M57_18090 [Candidatus Scalindua sp. AMX11]GJQ57298.1 MAG: hypothetical protein SCALA701_00990 [Candidatus Scalindua sp.]
MINEMEKQNFVTWHKYATFHEIEKAKGINVIAFQRLSHECADDIGQIDQPRPPSVFMVCNNVGVQEFDLSLKIS